MADKISAEVTSSFEEENKYVDVGFFICNAMWTCM
jgi:hypothetical protein